MAAICMHRPTTLVNEDRMTTMMSLALLLLLSTGTGNDAARILMTSPQVTSHVLMQLSVGSELVRLGHEVHVAVASLYPKPETITLKHGIGVIQYHYPLDAFFPISEERERLVVEMIFNPQPDWISNVQVVRKAIHDGCWFMMSDVEFLDRVRKLNFDIALVEPFAHHPCSLILPHYLGIPFVSMTSAIFPWHIGIPALPSFFGLVSPKQLAAYPELGSFVGRLHNTAIYAARGVLTWNLWSNTSLLEQYGDVNNPVSNWVDLLGQSQLFIVDRDHHLEEFAQPLLPNFIAVPGFTSEQAGPLPTDLEKVFSDSGDNGVILITFGSSASYMPLEVIQKFFDAFARLPQTVVAKFVVPDSVQVPPNVKLMRWLPQNDILGHPKTRLFITHCGSNGQLEAVYHGVPMVGMPLYAEQSWNCERATRKGFGLEVNILDFSADQLYDAIVKILPENSTYRAAVRQMSAILKSYPMNGRQTAAFWIDHVIKFGGKHLRSLSNDLPWYKFLMVDILVFLLIIAGVCTLCCVFCFRLVVRKCQRHLNAGLSASGHSKKTQ